MQYGPYHRLESPTQTPHVAMLQQRTGEIWGCAAQFSNIPSVKAYRGALPVGARGIEFTTVVAPHSQTHPTLLRWLETTPGVCPTPKPGFVSILVVVTKNTQV